MNSGIYGIVHVASGTCYVGQSARLRQRWSDHKGKLRRGTHRCPHLQHAWNKYGAEAFAFILLEHCEAMTLTVTEQFWMDYLRFIGIALYNSAPAAGSSLGHKHSEEAKAKMRANNVWTEERRQRLAASHRGLKASEDTRRKMSERASGKVLSNEHREHISQSMAGRPKSEAHRQKLAEATRNYHLKMKQVH